LLLLYEILQKSQMIETDRYIYFFETDTDVFKKFFTNICPAADIRLATDTDIPKFAYRYFCQYFKVF